MDDMIMPAHGRSRLFLPIGCFRKDDSQERSSFSHAYNTRHSNPSYHPRSDATSKPQDRSVSNKLREEKATSDEQRHKQLQFRDELQIGEMEGFDDTMLDPVKQQEIMVKIQKENSDLRKSYQPDQKQIQGPAQIRTDTYSSKQSHINFLTLTQTEPSKQTQYSDSGQHTVVDKAQMKAEDTILRETFIHQTGK